MIEEMIQKCEDFARKQQYCWFRMSFAKIGDVEPSWVVWFENLGHNELIDHKYGSSTLEEALKKLVQEWQL